MGANFGTFAFQKASSDSEIHSCSCFCSWNDTSEASAIAFDFYALGLLIKEKLLNAFKSPESL